MSYTSFSENKISEGMVAQFIIHLMLKYREPRFLEVQLNLENRFFFDTWVKVFRIIPEFRILRLTFHRKSIESQPQNAEFCR